ncbi:M56 family metallopeptidase [Longimicrobium sp.]|uniref:M56 family metallopeptidase n=1 Tax=Longimicrobium sp. TaxID=2029185 RepID=UPI003B3BD149
MSGMMGIDTAAAVSAVADLALKGTVVLAAAAIAAVMLRRAAASARHMAWTLGFAGLLALPVLGLALPSWRLPILPAEPVAYAPARSSEPARETRTADALRLILDTAPNADAAPAAAGTIETSAPAVDERSGMWDALGGVVVGSWMLGVLLALARLASSVTRVRREARTARPLADGPAAEMRDRLVWRMGIDRRVTLLEGAVGCMPLTWGVARPCVLLPAGTEQWPADRLEAVLTHELAHVRRRDCAWRLVAEAACALHWFNPLAWAAARRLRLESEHACDDQVLIAGSRGADYAGHLLDVARTLRPPRATPLAAVPMARPSQLRTRLHAVLSAERARGPVPAHVAAPALIGAGALLAVIAALTPARAGAAEPLTVAPAPCFVPARGSSFDEETDVQGVYTARWNTGTCSGSARMEGDVRFADDYTAVRSVAPGGTFQIALRDGGRSTEVVLRAGERGGIHRTLRIGGREVAWGPEGERWLASALSELMGISQYGANHRAATLLAQQGADAVAGETDRAANETLRSEYAAALLRGGLDPVTMSRALDGVATLEDYAEVPDLLLRAADLVPADPRVHAAYLRAAGRIGAEADLRRVLTALAAPGKLRTEGWMEMFRHARRIGGGKELALLLIGIAPALPADGRVHAEYLALSRRLGDDADRRHALAGLIASRKVDAAMQVRVIGEAAALGSEREKERMMTQIAPLLSRDARVAQAFEAAAGSIGGAPARARVMAAWSGAAAPDQAPSPADTVPEENLDDTDGTTVLSHQQTVDGRRSDLVLLARDVLLTADRRDFERISGDGFVVFRETAEGATRRVRIQPGSDGRLRYTWNGDFSGTDRDAWLRRMFTHFADSTRPNRRW